MSKIVLTILAILISANSFSQDNENSRFQLGLKTAPLQYINYFTWSDGTFNLGIELGLKNKFSLYTEASIFPTSNNKYIKPEFRFYFLHKEDTYHYLSLEYFRKELNITYTDSITIPSTPSYQKTYGIHKMINAISLKYGAQLYLNPRFSFDLFAGIGLRTSRTTFNGITNQELENRKIGSPERGLFLEGGFHRWPNITIGFRLCFDITKR